MKKKRTSPDPGVPARRLAALRGRIDRLDRRLVSLLNARTALAVSIGHIKQEVGDPVFSPQRERDVMKRIAASGQGPLRAADLRAIYREIMAAALSAEGGLVLGWLHADGAGAVAAARQRFGDAAVLRSFATPAALGRALNKGQVALAVVAGRSRKHVRDRARELETVRVTGVRAAYYIFTGERGS